MKIVITGANGFIGKSIYNFFRRKGALLFPIEHKELRGIKYLKIKMEEYKPDYIIHLAAFGNHSHQKNIKKIFQANVENTFNLLFASREISYKGFINVGSSSEYGNKNKPMKENDFLEPNTFYSATKAASTYISQAFASVMEKPVVSIRPFSVYGEREAEFRFIPTIINSIESNKEMKLDPNPKHDWIYIEDFINGVYMIMKNIDKYKGQTINIGTGKQFKNIEVVKAIEKIAGKKLKIKISEKMRVYDDSNWVADNKKLRKLGWRQQYSLNTGLKKTYDFYKK